jgi:hypothetical protein
MLPPIAAVAVNEDIRDMSTLLSNGRRPTTPYLLLNEDGEFRTPLLSWREVGVVGS